MFMKKGKVLFLYFFVLLIVSSRLMARVPSIFPEENRPPNDLKQRWNYISYIPPKATNINPSERALGSGLWADKAWKITTGDFGVVIAVLDSGIKWDEQDLIRKIHLNAGELNGNKRPEFDYSFFVTSERYNAWYCEGFTEVTGNDGYDLNGDGVFNIEDYCADPRVKMDAGDDPADNILDPSDLIHTFSDGVDDDGDGYVDDIAGWDFFWNDNDPYDDPRYGHGTGEAKDSGAEGDNGRGGIGSCPDCSILPVRVSDSFMADVNNFAEGVIFAVDSGAKVIQEALGSINNNTFAQDAINYAYRNGVVVVASAADEDSYHHNYPASNEKTLHVNAIRYDANKIEDSTTFLSFSNCTNYGVKIMVSAPSTTCSSGATGILSGVVGLIYSEAVQSEVNPPLSAEEVLQIVKMSADDIYILKSINNKYMYPHYKGWDRFTGYGRVNAYKAVRMVAEGKIPPEVRIDYPIWWQNFDPLHTPVLSIKGYVNAKRARSFSYKVLVGYGLDPQKFTTILEKNNLTAPVKGELAELNLKKVPFDYMRSIPQKGFTLEDIWEKTNLFSVTIIVQAVDDSGNKAESRKTIYVFHDKDLMPGFPEYFGSSGESALNIADIDNDGKMEIIMALADGSLHVIKADGTEADGFPVYVNLLEGLDEDSPVNKQHYGSNAYKSGQLNPEYHSSIVASPAVGDLDGDGNKDIVVATLDGKIFAFDNKGELLPGFPVGMDPSHYRHTDPMTVIDHGFFSTPVLADLDRDGTLEIIAAGMDSYLYAWHCDGTPVDGFPVKLVDSSYSDSTACMPGSYVNLITEPDPAEKCIEHGAPMRIIASPSVGDVDGDGYPEIVVATGEDYARGKLPNDDYVYNGRVYLVNRFGEIMPGWPVSVPTLAVLPYIGRGIPDSPVLADFNHDGKLDIVVQTIATGLLPSFVFNYKGKRIFHYRNFAWDPTYPGQEGLFSAVLLNSPSIADLNGDGTPDIINGGISSNILERFIFDGKRVDADHQIMAWNGKTGKIMDFFPKIIEDWQFFGNYTVADLDNDGSPEILAGSGGGIVHAYKSNSWGELPGWPKFTGQWIITAPVIGDIDGDGYLEVAVNTRKGFLYVWKTHGYASKNGRTSIQWQSFQHDERNTGNYTTPIYVQKGPVLKEKEKTEGCSCQIGESRCNVFGLIFTLLIFIIGIWMLRRKYA